MKYPVLFYILVLMPGLTQCRWKSCAFRIGRTIHSYVVGSFRKRATLSFHMPTQSHTAPGCTNKKLYPSALAASIMVGAPTYNTAYCKEDGQESHWYDVEKPNHSIGVYPSLALAAKIGDDSAFKKLLDEGADPNSAGPFGSALHMATCNGRMDMVQELVARGADVWQENDASYLPIDGAIENGRADIFMFLLNVMNNTKDVEKKSQFGFWGFRKKRRHELLGKRLYVAAQYGQVKMMQELVACGVDAWQKSNGGMLPLHYAVDIGQEGVVRYLLTLDDAQKDMVNMPNACNMRPLDYAIEKGHQQMIGLLVSHGALVYPHMVRDAINIGGVSFKLLFEHACNGESIEQSFLDELLLEASRRGNLAIVRYLYAQGADINGGVSKTSPLIEAAAHGHTSLVQFLCSKGADLNKKDSSTVGEFSALHKAATNGHTAVVEILLDAGADPFIQDFTGYSPSSSHVAIAWVLFCKRLSTPLRWLTD